MSNEEFTKILKQIKDGRYSKEEIILNDCELNNSDVKKLLKTIKDNDKLNKKLTKLVISKNPSLTEIHVDGLEKVEELKLDKNNLKKIVISNMQDLEVLLINENNFTDFNFDSIDVESFRKLDLSKNKLLSFKICKPIDIELLDISENPITTLFFDGSENISQIEFCKNAMKTKLGIVICKNIMAQKLYGMYIKEVHEMIEENKETLSVWLNDLTENNVKQFVDEHIKYIINSLALQLFKESEHILKELIILENLKESKLASKLKGKIDVDVGKLTQRNLLNGLEKAFKESLSKRVLFEEIKLHEIFSDLFKSLEDKIKKTEILCKKNTQKEIFRNKNAWPKFNKLYTKDIDKGVKTLKEKLEEPFNNINKFIINEIEKDVENISKESNLGEEFVRLMNKNKPYKR